MYQAYVENHGDLKFQAVTSDYNFVMALNGEGANPVETLLAGLCGCIGHYVRDFMRERKLSCPSFAVKAEARQTEDKSRLSEIDLWLDMKNGKLEKREEADLLKYVEKCKLHNTLKTACKINLALV